MRVKFDSLNRFERPVFTVCNPGSVYKDGVTTNTIGVVRDTSDEEIVFNFNAVSVLNFRANKNEYDDELDNDYAHKIYDSLQNRRSIFVDGIGFFVISSTNEVHERKATYKDIVAESCEAEIQRKKLTYIEDGTHKFDYVFDNVLGVVPKWKRGYVSPRVSNRYRTFEDINFDKNTLAFMLEDMQNAYECIFVFNIMDRIVHVYDQAEYVTEAGSQTNISISKDNVIRHLKITENSDNLYTAVTAVGGDNITISAINPIGSSTVYNFSHYLGWMSDGLRNKVIEWSERVDFLLSGYIASNIDYYDRLEDISYYESEIERLKINLQMYKNCRDNIVATSSTDRVAEYNKVISDNGGDAVTISNSIDQTVKHIESIMNDIEGRQIPNAVQNLEECKAERDDALSDIQSVHNSVAIKNFFTEEEYDELYDYIYEGNYNDEYVVITDTMNYVEKFEQMRVLYDRTVAQLKRTSVPTREFQADVESFIFVKEFLPWSEQIETGCLIDVELEQGDIASLFLSSMVVNYAEKTMSMTFGNRYNKFDPKTLFDNVLGSISKSANSIDYIKELVVPMKDGSYDVFVESVRNARNLTMKDAITSTNQDFVVDATGITGRKLYPDTGNIDPKQVKIVNNSIVFTTDDWNTCDTAIGEILLPDGKTKSYGVNAKTLIGEVVLGGELHIYDDEGNDIFTVIDNKIESNLTSEDGSFASQIAQTANEIKATVAQSVSKYNIPSADKIDMYGYGHPNDNDYDPKDYSGKYYLDQNSGKRYLSNGSSWSNDKTYTLITSSLQTQIDQKPDSISLGVSKDNEQKAGIVLSVDGEECGRVDISGMVTFSDLAGSGTTEINGSNITTGKINAANVGVTGALSVYDGAATDASGKVGYLSGKLSDDTTTNGIGVSADDSHYLIATSNGVRMQAGTNSVFAYTNASGTGGGVVVSDGTNDYNLNHAGVRSMLGFGKELYSGSLAENATSSAIPGLDDYMLYAVYFAPVSGWASKNAPVIILRDGGYLRGSGGIGSNSPGTTDDCSELYFVNCTIDNQKVTVKEAAACQVFTGGGTSQKKSTSITKIVGLI